MTSKEQQHPNTVKKDNSSQSHTRVITYTKTIVSQLLNIKTNWAILYNIPKKQTLKGLIGMEGITSIDTV